MEVILHSDLERYVDEQFYREYLTFGLDLFTLESLWVTEDRAPDEQSLGAQLWRRHWLGGQKAQLR